MFFIKFMFQTMLLISKYCLTGSVCDPGPGGGGETEGPGQPPAVIPGCLQAYHTLRGTLSNLMAVFRHTIHTEVR